MNTTYDIVVEYDASKNIVMIANNINVKKTI